MLPPSLLSQNKSLLCWQEIYSRQIRRSFPHKGSGNIPARIIGLVPTVAILVIKSVEEGVGQHLMSVPSVPLCGQWQCVHTHALGSLNSIIFSHTERKKNVVKFIQLPLQSPTALYPENIQVPRKYFHLNFHFYEMFFTESIINII